MEGKRKFGTSRWRIGSWMVKYNGFISAAATKVKTGAIKVYKRDRGRPKREMDLKKKHVVHIQQRVKDGLVKVIQPTLNVLTQFKYNFIDIFNSKIMKNIKAFLSCLKNKPEFPKDKKDMLNKFLANASFITNGVRGWVTMIIKFICYMNDLYQAIEYFLNGIAGNKLER